MYVGISKYKFSSVCYKYKREKNTRCKYCVNIQYIHRVYNIGKISAV